MSASQIPSKNQGLSFISRASRTWRRFTTPHPSVKAIGDRRRAQLLSILTLILSFLFVGAVVYGPRSYGVFLALSGITLTSYALSRTEYFRIGTYLFTYVFTAIGYLRIYQGAADSMEAAVVSTVHVSLVLSSVLLSQRGFLALVVLSTAATFAAPFYSNVPVSEMDNVGRAGGIVLVIGAILYGINIFRTNLDKEQLEELGNTNTELEDIKESLEKRIAARTLELQAANQQTRDRAARLQIVSELSQEISASVGLRSKEMLTTVTKAISEKLGYYHVGIFLLDENREYAILRAANSEGGQQMLSRTHQLRVGGTGIVGYVAQSGYPRIALDTGTDAVFFNNPDLPETRSEMALPLKHGASVMGVLDVQSTLPSAFNDEDAGTLSTLANQLAIVITNLQTRDEADVGPTSGRMSSRGRQLSRAEKSSGYSINPDGTISSVPPKIIPSLDKAITSGEIVILAQPPTGSFPSLAVPVKFRDRVVGIIHVEAAEPNRRWSDDEVAMVQAISDRAAFALENARLFEGATRRAEQEETIARVTTQIGSSTDFTRILQTTIQELGQALGASRSFIQIGTPSENERSTDPEQ